MTNEVTTVETGSFLEAIKQAALDPSVDIQKMHGLLDIQERLMNKQAEINFNSALGGLQSDLPRIKKDGKIQHRDKNTGKMVDIAGYATYESIDDIIRPLYLARGFSLRFNTRESNGKVVVTGTLSHKDGYSITDEVPLSIDASGAKNNVQGVGSTIAYGKRYLVGMLLNLVFDGEDDDGKSSGFIPLSDEQAEEIKTMLKKSGADVSAFLKWAKASTVDEMDAIKYDAAINLLNAKLKEKENI